ncbi:MAG: DEAD/DEAH box helicase [Candidatus Sericytochromatia bacterium]|nr:DEAD/DEAH box helicase [Candidatus Sericytochromatia bacterium]
MTTFHQLGLPAALCDLLLQEGIETPSEPQAQSFTPLVEGRHLLLSAQTGSGKTLAYLLPLWKRLESLPSAPPPVPGRPAAPRLLILVPTQELGVQVRDVVRLLWGERPGAVLALIGGANPERQREALKRAPEVVVGTPGRVADFVSRQALTLSAVRAIVLDEADHLAEAPHRADVVSLFHAAPSGRQVVACSATLSSASRDWLAGLLSEPVVVDLATELTLPATLRHQVLVTPERDQLPTLRKLLHHLAPTGAIAFFNRAADIDWLVAKLVHHGVRAAGLHAGLRKLQRTETMRAFRGGQLQLLVATELAARGLDLGGCELVFNLDLPRSAEQYVHRVGRTGRMGRAGLAITLVDPTETRLLSVLERALGLSFEPAVYAFGELRAPEPVDEVRARRRAAARAERGASKEKPGKAEASGGRAKTEEKKGAAKKSGQKAPTARQVAKGKARKAARKSAGAWKRSSGVARPGGGTEGSSSAPNSPFDASGANPTAAPQA